MRLVRGGGGCYLAVSERKKKGKSCPFSGVHRVTRTYVQTNRGQNIRRARGPAHFDRYIHISCQFTLITYSLPITLNITEPPKSS